MKPKSSKKRERMVDAPTPGCLACEFIFAGGLCHGSLHEKDCRYYWPDKVQMGNPTITIYE